MTISTTPKNIVITGCTKGIGLAVALAFAQKGFNIVGCARNQTDLDNLNAALLKINSQSQNLLMVCDVSNEAALTTFAQAVAITYKQVDVLVNNAGVFLPGTIADEPIGRLENMLTTNVLSAYKITKLLLPAMITLNSAHIFNICSIASLQAYNNGGSYTISKFALLGFSKQLRHELKTTGVKVTAIMPGATKTNSWEGTDLPDERFIKPEDIAKTICSVLELSNYTDVEEIVVRPQQGDI